MLIFFINIDLVHSLPYYVFYTITYPQAPRQTNKSQPTTQNNQRHFPPLIMVRLQCTLATWLAYKQKEQFPFPNRENCFRFLKNKQMLTVSARHYAGAHSVLFFILL